MTNNFKLMAMAMMVSSASSFAQVATTTVNHGSVSNTVSTSAVVTGPGTSYSAATGAAGAFSGATTSYTIGSTPTSSGINGHISGDMHTYTSGNAFNASTGSGQGAATSVASASADGSSTLVYSAPGQTLYLSGNDASATTQHVYAVTNQSGFGNSATSGVFTGDGYVGSSVTSSPNSRDVQVYGGVSDTKATNSSSAAGVLTVTGLPANTVLTNAIMGASANATVNVNGNFGDPVQ